MKKSLLALAITFSAGAIASDATSVDTGNPEWAGDTAHWSFFLYGQTPYPVQQGILDSELAAPEGYNVVHTNIMGRHGSRYATGRHESVDVWADWFSKVAERGQLTEKGKQYQQDIQGYVNAWSEDTAGHITQLGYEEMIAIGERAAEAMDQDKLEVIVGNSGALRAQQTQDGFVEGVEKVAKATVKAQGDEVNFLIDPQSGHPNNPDMRFYHDDVRPPMYRMRQDNFDYHTERPSQSAMNLAEQYVEGLNQTSAGELVFAMYRLCQQDASQDYVAKMCAPFESYVDTAEGKETYTWLRDIIRWEQFYYFGPAAMNQGAQQVMSKPLLQDILNSTAAAAEGKAASDIQARFGHDAGMAGLYIALGLIQDRGYDRDREESWMQYGQVPMGGNMIWQLLENQDNPSDLQVRMLVNEQVMSFPFADGKDMVAWDEVKAHYQSYLDSVNTPEEYRKTIGSYVEADRVTAVKGS
ncbi:histidine-type phosphatase [Photobacterium sanctipauli]|uniref:Multiple inositol polyphosphate phosphatase 1 n=1 Tax=Photobacterium sanctipauli TaxID=1342794 RepID=A0A2T3NX01_9GAMM|nr:histidine phosphatase family protein [Photobacterium sanctipauli]PSW20786.1 histidine-type phosphatase [Photobacterium sanctipauli]